MSGASCRSAALMLLSTLACLGLGCGGRGNVSGKVKLVGNTIQWGTVTFIGSDGVARVAKIDLQGQYQVKDLPLGEAKIAVASPDPRGEDVPAAFTWYPLPGKYVDPATSGLTWEVKRGDNEFDIDLELDRPK